jgi:iron(II)-dependent oxidoreductase
VRPTNRQLIEGLLDARSVELEMFRGLTGPRLFGRRMHFAEPPIWEIGHVGWTQELWLLRKLRGEAPLMPESDSIYDSFNVSYKIRWDHAFPSRRRTLRWISEILRRCVDRLDGRPPTDEEIYFYTFVAQHEQMHSENLCLLRQTYGYPAPRLSIPSRPQPDPDPEFRGGDVEIPGGTFAQGAERSWPFVFDNEKWAHPVRVEPFRISAAPVTNAQFVEFVEDGGYRTRRHWTKHGWEWRRREKTEAPLFWRKRGAVWHEQRFDRLRPLEPWHPVLHVNWHEAKAFCAWAGRRLPTEAEWEFAAAIDRDGRKRLFPWGDEPPTPERTNLDYGRRGTVDVRALPAGDSPWGCRQMIGNVWEWVEDTFGPYPGFEPDPYREYSQPYFGKKKVLKGGCWATRSSLIRNTWRNFYKHQRRNIFAGFRTAAR